MSIWGFVLLRGAILLAVHVESKPACNPDLCIQYRRDNNCNMTSFVAEIRMRTMLISPKRSRSFFLNKTGKEETFVRQKLRQRKKERSTPNHYPRQHPVSQRQSGRTLSKRSLSVWIQRSLCARLYGDLAVGECGGLRRLCRRIFNHTHGSMQRDYMEGHGEACASW